MQQFHSFPREKPSTSVEGGIAGRAASAIAGAIVETREIYPLAQLSNLAYHVVMPDVIYNRNCAFQTAYHVVWCPKYRHDVLVGGVAKSVAEMIDAICLENNWPVLAKEIQPDHVHLFVTIPPATAVADAVKILKGTTARKLFVAFPALKRRLWGGHLWSPSYYVGTAGNVSAETIRKYIERSEHMQKRR